MNKVMMMGRLTRDPEVSYSQSNAQMAIGRFSIAVDRKFKRPDDTVTADFFNCVAFGKLGEFVEKYLKQGTKVVVIGRLQNDNYTNKEGQKVYSVRIIAEEIEFAESKAAAERNTFHGDFGGVPSSGEMDVKPATEEFMNVSEDGDSELPF